MKKIIMGVIGSVLVISGCSSSSEENISNMAAEELTLQEVRSAALWRTFENEGVSEYLCTFNESHQDNPFVDARKDLNPSCGAKALKMDDGTLYMDELETLFQEGELVDGVCGKALSLQSGEVAPLGVNLIDSMKTGTVEFWFRPGEDFYDQSARTLLGNDEARMHFFMQNGNLVFQKNHADQHFFVKGAVKLEKDWNLIGGQWGDGFLSLWVNGELVARVEHDLGYVPSLRGVPFGNLVVVGYKSGCCMEGPGQFSGMTTSGDFDQFRISKALRYRNEVENVIDSAATDTVKEVLECSESALIRDDNTLYMEEFDSTFASGTMVDGVCGMALSLNNDESVALNIELADSIAEGTVEFWFRPGEDFDAVSARTLLGNDGSRVHFMVKDSVLYFQKNLADLHFFAKGKANFKDGWNFVAGQWGDGYLSVWLNGELVGYTAHEYGYSPSLRSWMESENVVRVGRKSSCCMEGIPQYDAMTTSGAFDQLRISNVMRYEVIPFEQPADTLAVEENYSFSTEVDSLTDVSSAEVVDSTMVVDSLFVKD